MSKVADTALFSIHSCCRDGNILYIADTLNNMVGNGIQGYTDPNAA